MTSEYTIRGATVEDVEMIMHQRSAMFIEMGVNEAQVRHWETAFGVWVRERLGSGAYRGWLAVDAGGAVVAGAGLWIHEWVPSPLTGKPVRGYLLNVYTEPEHRQQGLARRLVAATLDHCREQGIPTAALNASEAGRPIYAAMGFTDTGEMRLRLE